MASTGIAAELLYGGATVHKRLCRQKHVDSSTRPFVDYRSQFADTIRKLHGIIIDEISMQHKDVLEFVDRLLRSVAPRPLKNIPFGGKVILQFFKNIIKILSVLSLEETGSNFFLSSQVAHYYINLMRL